MALRFNGTTDRARIASVPSTATDNYAMAAWIYPTVNNRWIMQNGHGGGFGEGYGFYLSSTNKITVDLAYVAGFSSVTTVPLNKWTHVIYQRRAGLNLIYINGRREPNTITNAPFTPGTSFHVGCGEDESGVGSGFFQGGMEDVALWERGLTDGECLLLGTGAIRPKNLPRNLKQYYPFTNRYSYGKDYVASNNLTLTTAPAISYDTSVNGGSTAASTTHTYSHTCTSATFLVVFPTAGVAVTGVTYNGVAMTAMSGFSAYYLVNPAAGANNVVITCGSATTIYGLSASYKVSWLVSQPDNQNNQTNNGVSSGSWTGISVTTRRPNCWSILFAYKTATGAISAGGGSTLRVGLSTAGSAIAILDSNSAIASPSSYGMNALAFDGTQNWVLGILSIAPDQNSLQFPSPPYKKGLIQFASAILASTWSIFDGCFTS